MDCGTCGSQDTTFKQGVSKKTGKPWQAYDCNNPSCKGETGYPSRTFVFTPKSRENGPKGHKTAPVAQANGSNIEVLKKLDQILEILHENFGENPEVHVKDEETPF